MDRCADCGKISDCLRDGYCYTCYHAGDDDNDPEQHEDEW